MLGRRCSSRLGKTGSSVVEVGCVVRHGPLQGGVMLVSSKTGQSTLVRLEYAVLIPSHPMLMLYPTWCMAVLLYYTRDAGHGTILEGVCVLFRCFSKVQIQYM